jgi:solute:Na+ symporter, SSS family
MLATLSPIDTGIIIVYLVFTTMFGVWFSGQQKDVKTYFVGDRNVHWFMVLISIVATETSTVTFLSVPGVSYDPKSGNFTFLQLAFGYIIGRLAVAWFLIPQYFRGESFTAYQLLREKFNPTVQRVASGLFLITRTIADGLRLFLTALLLKQFTGWNMEMSILVMGIVTIVYTFLGGMQAVIWTDLIQFVIYILGAVFAGILILQLLPGGMNDFLASAQEQNKFRLFDFSWNPSSARNFWSGLIGGAFFSMASHGVDQLMVQRYLCSRTMNQARLALILSGIVVLVQFVLFLLIGIGLYFLQQHGILKIPSDTPNDEVFGIFMIDHLPNGLLGFVIAAVLAAAMSTLSSSLNSSSTALITDFYRPMRPNKSEKEYLIISRLTTIGWGIAQMAVALIALYIQSQRAIIDQVLSVAGFTTGIILGIFLLGSMRRIVSPKAAMIGMIVGFSVVVSIWLTDVLKLQLPEWMNYQPPAWPWYAPIGSLTTFGVATLLDRLGIGHGSSTHRSS